MSITKLIPSLLVAALAVGMTTSPVRAQTAGAGAVVITDVDLDGVTVVNGVLKATGGTVTGTLAGLPFVADLTNFALQLVPGLPGGGGAGACSVLDLELGPIDLDLLGLSLDTSPICLNIVAMEGGGLLGDLLCDLTGGLNLGLLDLDDLTAALPGVLSAVLTNAIDQAGPPAAGAEDICDGECEILDLAVGPVDLNLLGLNVHLDDCDDGPVQVCISASSGDGLLGDLLCGLADGGILPDLGDLNNLLGVLLGDALNLDLTGKQLDKLVNQVSKLLKDGELSTQDINKLRASITKLIRKA